MSPFIVLFIGIAVVIIAITVLKIHPFFSLVLAALTVGVLAEDPVSIAKVGISTFKDEGMKAALHTYASGQAENVPQATLALKGVLRAFGNTAGGIGIVIALAAVVGLALMESGAADRITRTLLGFLGERRANYALLGSGYVLSIPVFFDTVFFLLVPIARALRMRTGKNFLAYVMAICAGGALTHGLVPPTPGPLVMANSENLNIPLGECILGGFLLGLPVAIFGGILLPKLLFKFIEEPPLREAPGATLEELDGIAKKPDSELPGLLPSIAPVALPVIFITSHSIVDAIMLTSPSESLSQIHAITSVLGDKLFALGLGTVIALLVLKNQKRYTLKQLTATLEPGLMAAGTIILITCAGGSFGQMLKASGLGDAIKEQFLGEGEAGVRLLLIAWGVAAVMKVAQGSGTVSMITSASIMAGILSIPGVELPFHKIYIFAAIAYGSMSISWMNDSGFWVVCKMSGFTEKETLKTWTVLLGSMCVVGLIEILILCQLLPLV